MEFASCTATSGSAWSFSATTAARTSSSPSVMKGSALRRPAAITLGSSCLRATSTSSGADAGEWFLRRTKHLAEGRGDGVAVLAKDDHALGGVAPPAVRAGEMRDELGGGLVHHTRRRTRFEIFVDEAVDAALADVFIEPPFVDDTTQVAALPSPVALLDDSAVHVDDGHAAVGHRLRPERAEVHIGSPHELTLRLEV